MRLTVYLHFLPHNALGDEARARAKASWETTNQTNDLCFNLFYTSLTILLYFLRHSTLGDEERAVTRVNASWQTTNQINDLYSIL